MILLRRLEISGLRGLPAKWPPINVRTNGLVVYGPNGSGKSSIVDGIEYALKGTTSLFPENRQGVSWEKGSPHVKGGPRKANIICEVDGAEYNLNDGSTLPVALQRWRDIAATSSFVLRRHMLLRFVGSQPAVRYDQLEPFFNVAEFTAYEAKLQAIAGAYVGRATDQEVALAKDAQRLRILLGLENGQPINAAAVETVLSNSLKVCGFHVAVDSSSLATRRTEIDGEMKGFAADAKLTQLAALKQKFTELVPSSAFEIVLTQLSEAQSAFEKAEADRTESIAAEFLKQGRDFIAANTAPECPLCESKIDPASVLERLAARIANDEKFASAKAKFENLARDASVPISLHLRDFKAAIAAWNTSLGEDLPPAYGDEVNLLQDLVSKLGLKKPISDLADLIASIKASIESHKPRLERIDKAVAEGGGQRRAALQNLLQLIEIQATEFSSYGKKVAALETIRRRMRVAERVHGHAVLARKEIVQKIVAELALQANKYYESIHPGEGISKSSLDVRDVGAGSVDISTEFAGTVEHPMLHLSESHLDTLGLCFFLAARRMEHNQNPDFGLLVLDDVVHSVDADHRDRVASLLTKEFSDHQLIVVTHDSIFYHRLRHYFGSQFEYLYFSSWSLDAGPVRTTSSTDVDRVTIPAVRETLTADELAAACGRFFEFLLRIVAERLNVPLPARFTKPHDIGNMWPSLYGKLKKAKNAPAALKDVAEKINDNQWIRNQVGAHYNEPAVPVSDKEVQRLAEALTEFYALMFCSKCRTSVEKKGDDDWRCECEALQYKGS